MKAALRLLLWGVLGAAALVVLLLIGVWAFVDPNEYRAEIADAVKSHTGRELRIDGELKLSVFPWIAIDVGRASLGNAQGFGDEPMMAIERARVGVRLIPLLSKELEARRITIDGLRLRLTAAADGRDNWSDLVGSEAKEPRGTAASSGFRGRIAGLTLRNASIRYEDQADESVWNLEGLHLTTGRLEAARPVSFKLEGSFNDGGRGTSGTIALTAKLTAAADAQALALNDFNLSANVKTDPRASVTWPIALEAPVLALDLQAQTLQLDPFTLRVAGAAAAGALSGEKIFDSPALSGRIEFKPQPLRPLLAKLAIELPATRDPKAFESLAFTSEFKATSSSLTLQKLVAKLDGIGIKGRAGIASFKTNELRFDLDLDRVDIDRYRSPEPPANEAAAAEPAELPVDSLRDLDARGELRIGEASLAGIALQDLRLGISAAGDTMRLFPSQATLYGGRYAGDVRLDAKGDDLGVAISAKVTDIDFAPLMKDLLESERLSGRGSADIQLSGRGRTSDALLDSLKGKLSLDVRDGALNGIDIWYELRRARALLKSEPVPEPEPGKRTPFETLQVTANVERGVATTDDLSAATAFLKLTGAGQVGIKAPRAIDMRLLAVVNKVPASGAGSEAQDLVAAKIPVRVTGTVADPKVRPDVGGLAKERVKQELEKKKDDLKEKLRNKLKDLFGRAP